VKWSIKEVLILFLNDAAGGNMPGIKKRGTVITGCRDWLRPVISKVERMDND